MTAASGGPLSGLRVVEFAGLGPAPFAGMLLSDMGADVLRIDRPGAPPASPFAVTERGRRSVVLDLKDPAGRGAALRLLERADILIEGFRPQVMERLGLGPDAALERNPRLVYGRMTGWGRGGPYAGMAGHDLNYVALTGALHMIGPKERPMAPLNLVGDYGGGGAFLVIGVLAALQHAQRTGEGQVVEAAMVDGVSTLMAALYGVRAAGALPDERESSSANGGAHYMGPYECADGRFIVVAAHEPQFYRLLLEILGLADDPALADQRDPAQWPGQKARIAEVVATRTRDEWCAIMEGTDACFAPILTMAEAPRHPQNVARQVFVEPGGVVQPAPAPRFARTPGSIKGPPPQPGADHEGALRDWGFTADEIAALRP